MRNRLANVFNPYQSNATKALCVCSAGLLRSPTIAKVLTEKGYNTRAAGMSKEYALIPVDTALLVWAEEIHVVKEQEEALRMALKVAEEEGFNVKRKPKVYVYDIPDAFETFDPVLVDIIEEEYSKITKE